MKKLTLFILLACCLAFAGCNKDAEINTFLADFEGVTKDMTKKLEEGDVAGAKTAFESKKESLKTSWENMKNARDFQVSAEAKKKLEESVQKNVTELTTAAGTAAIKSAGDAGKAQEIQALLKDYVGIFTM